jgi:hypothetical protein
MYLSPTLNTQYNDVEVPYDITYYQTLLENGIQIHFIVFSFHLLFDREISYD